jgi:hypothetical protein
MREARDPLPARAERQLQNPSVEQSFVFHPFFVLIRSQGLQPVSDAAERIAPQAARLIT